MKIKIKESQLSLIEALNLNLAKGLTRYQKRKPVTEELDAIFGKNVYRLYYELQSGKQIFPTAKSQKTNLKLDIKFTDELKDNITQLLSTKQYSIVDFNNNVAKNDLNNQQIKITKILSGWDNDYLKKYNLYLDSISKGITNNENMCVVISRHAYDIGGMSTDREEWSSCEDLSGILSVKDLNNLKDKDDDYVGDGDGLRIGQMIRNGDFIFYTIKYGDWNIQHPYSRFASGVYCVGETYGAEYGRKVSGFSNFIARWIREYDSKIKGYNLKDLDLIVQKDKDYALTQFYYNKGYESYGNLANFLRIIFKYKRDDFFEYLLFKDRGEFTTYNVDFIDTLYKLFGKNFLTYLKPELAQKIKKNLDKFIGNIAGIQERFRNREKFYQTFMSIKDVDPKHYARVINSMLVNYDYYSDINCININKQLFYAFYGKSYVLNLLEFNQKELQGLLVNKRIENEYLQYLNKHMENKLEPVSESIINEKLVLKNWKEYCSLVADEYDTLQDYNPSVISHWIALNKSNHEWFKKLTNQVNIIFVTDNKKYFQHPGKINIDGKDYSLIYLGGGVNHIILSLK